MIERRAALKVVPMGWRGESVGYILIHMLLPMPRNTSSCCGRRQPRWAALRSEWGERAHVFKRPFSWSPDAGNSRGRGVKGHRGAGPPRPPVMAPPILPM